jgi:hypothetical protein
MDHGFTDALDHLAFGLIGIAVIAAGIGSLGSLSGADPIAVGAAAAVPTAAVTYDVDLLVPTWLPTDFAEAEVPPEAPVGSASAEVPPVAAPVAVAQGSDGSLDRVDASPAAARPERSEAKGHHGAVRAGTADAVEPRRGRACEEPADPLIVAEGSGSYNIREAVIQRYTRDWSRLGDLGWSEVHRGADGKADGMRIGGIRCGSDPWDAGFRSGDVIHSVNGRRVHNIPQVIAAYAALSGKRAFEVELSRGGARRIVRYRLT